MKNFPKHERGQALIVIAIGLVALFALVALSVDGNNIYSDRRHAQNAADTAVLAAARSFVRYPGNASEPQYEPAALSIADSNGYDNNLVTNSVVVSYPAIDLPGSIDPADADEYVEVTITSVIKLDFAPMIGTSQHTNVVHSVARVIPVTYTDLFNGAAAVGLSQACNHPVVSVQGNSTTHLVGGGLFANASSCNDDALHSNSGATHLDVTNASPGICSAGGDVSDASNIGISSATNCPAVSIDDFIKPNIVCTTTAAKTGNSLSPGNYTGTFPPSGVSYLESGTYCIHGDFVMHNSAEPLWGDNVLIYLIDGGVSITGGDLHITGPDSGAYKGLSMYIPAENGSSVTINGNADNLNWNGTILAPGSDVSLTGGSGDVINGRIIGSTLDLNGGSGLVINYNPDDNWVPPTTPTVELVQ